MNFITILITVLLGYSYANPFIPVFTGVRRYSQDPLDYWHPLNERSSALNLLADSLEHFETTKFKQYMAYFNGTDTEQKVAASELSLGERKYIDINLYPSAEEWSGDYRETQIREQFVFMMLTNRYIEIKFPQANVLENSKRFTEFMQNLKAVRYMRTSFVSEWARYYHYYGYPWIAYVDQVYDRYAMKDLSQTLVGKYLLKEYLSETHLLAEPVPVYLLIPIEMYLLRECPQHTEEQNNFYFEKWHHPEFYEIFHDYELRMIRRSWEVENLSEDFNTTAWPIFTERHNNINRLPPCCTYRGTQIECLMSNSMFFGREKLAKPNETFPGQKFTYPSK